MQIEPGAEALLKQMGRQMRTSARSKILERALTHLRMNLPTADITRWFSEPRFAPTRRTTIRLSADNIEFLDALASLTGKTRPALLLDIVYLAACVMKREDLEAA